MNIVVHIKNGKTEHGYEWGTRQAWACDVDEVSKVERVIGVIDSKIVCIIEGVKSELSTQENNPKHNKNCDGRFIFIGGECWTENDALKPSLPKLMYKKVKNLNQGHRYMTDKELADRSY